MTVAGWILAALGWAASLWLLTYEIRALQHAGQGAPRRLPELHVPAGLVAGVGVALLWGWPWGLAAGLLQAVGFPTLVFKLRG